MSDNTQSTRIIAPMLGTVRVPKSGGMNANEQNYIIVLKEGKITALFAEIYGEILASHEIAGVRHAFTPIAPHTTLEDIEGATHAWDDGTHWHFSHCSHDEHIDLAAETRTFAEQQFGMMVSKTQIKAAEATNDVVRNQAIAKAKAIVEFAGAVAAEAYKTVIAQTVGHYHRTPIADHKREITVAAINAVLLDWKQKGVTDVAIKAKRDAVRTDAEAVATMLGTTHTLQTTAQKAAADAAAAEAAKKKEAETQTETQTPAETPSGD